MESSRSPPKRWRAQSTQRLRGMCRPVTLAPGIVGPPILRNSKFAGIFAWHGACSCVHPSSAPGLRSESFTWLLRSSPRHPYLASRFLPLSTLLSLFRFRFASYESYENEHFFFSSFLRFAALSLLRFSFTNAVSCPQGMACRMREACVHACAHSARHGPQGRERAALLLSRSASWPLGLASVTNLRRTTALESLS